MADHAHLRASMLPIDHGGLVYFTPNGRRFYLGSEPKVEKVEGGQMMTTGWHVRPHTRIRYVEVKHPRVRKALRRRFRVLVLTALRRRAARERIAVPGGLTHGG